MEGGLVNIEAGLLWAKDNVRAKPPTGFTYFTTFAEEHGIPLSRGIEGRLIAAGLPVDQSGFVEVEKATSWLAERAARADKFESLAAFGRRVGAGSSTAQTWLSKGLPVNSAGLVDVERGLLWHAEYIRTRWRGRSKATSEVSTFALQPTLIAQRDFAKEAGIHTVTLTALIREGLPTHGKKINAEEAIGWIAAHPNPLRPSTAHIWKDVKTRAEFARLNGISKASVSRAIARGMPITDSGLVPLVQAQQWFHENTPSRTKRNRK